MRLSEKYRPGKLAEVLGQDRAVGVCARMMKNGLGGRAFWLTGKSGTGKTTLAKIMAAGVADEWDTVESVARELTANRIREIADRWIYVPRQTRHAWIVNEAHGLSKPCIEVLLDILERLPESVVVFFTTTNDGADLFEEHIDAGPFASRCICLKLTDQGLCPIFARRAKEIAEIEGLDGRPISDYEKLAKHNRNNFRAILNSIETGEMLA